MNIKLFLTNPKKIPIGLLYRFGHIIPDKTYLKLLYRAFLGKRLDLKNPKTFNEKLQWLKLNDRRDEYTIMVDKVEAKKWVAERIGEEYIIPTIGVWERPEDIDFDSLPEKFVMKTNHDSGMVCICTDKSKLDRDKVRRDMAISLKRDYYLTGREWPYKNVNRRILAEQFMVDESGYELKDYKIFCFDGEPQFIQVDFDRFAPTGHKRNLYSTEWKLLEVDYGYPSDSARNIERPSNLDTMLSFARKLSKGHRFLRTDFYAINGDTKFGEMTFFPECGFGEFSPDEWDTKLGKLIKLKSPSGGEINNLKYIVHNPATTNDLPDYKFMCFNGKVGMCFTCSERRSADGVKVTFFDNDWNQMPFTRHYPASRHPLPRPQNFEKMKSLAEQLAAGTDFLRVDFYEINGKIYFGELTFYPGCGFEEFTPDEWDRKIGDLIHLSGTNK